MLFLASIAQAKKCNGMGLDFKIIWASGREFNIFDHNLTRPGVIFARWLKEPKVMQPESWAGRFVTSGVWSGGL